MNTPGSVNTPTEDVLTERPAREVWIVARRETVAALGRRGFVASTALLLAALVYTVLGLDPAQPVTGPGVRAAVGFGTGTLIFLSLTLYGISLAQGVVEEKAGRVAELLLATIRPWQLLAGKVIGVGVGAVVQLGVLVGGGLALAVATGRLGLDGPILAVAGWGAVWFALGFGLYATLIAAAGATVSRQEDVSSAVQPVLMLLFAPFVASLYLGGDPTGPLVGWLSMVPLLSPFLMPIRMAFGPVPLWQSLLAVVLTAVAVTVAARLAGRIYAGSVLRTGGRIRLRQALA